jgi:hypothetical protein
MLLVSYDPPRAEPGQLWFDKHELRIYQNLMVDFDHHIFTAILASQGQFY